MLVTFLPYMKRIYQQHRGGDENVGIIAASGDVWKDQKCSDLKTVKDFGLGKPSMEAMILDEVKEFSEQWIQDLNNNDELPTNNLTFTMFVVNMLWRIVPSRRLNRGNTEDVWMVQAVNSINSNAGPNLSLRTIITHLLPEALRKYKSHFNQNMHMLQIIYDTLYVYIYTYIYIYIYKS